MASRRNPQLLILSNPGGRLPVRTCVFCGKRSRFGMSAPDGRFSCLEPECIKKVIAAEKRAMHQLRVKLGLTDPRLNPTGETIPDERRARRAWAKFHLASESASSTKRIPDVPGLPKTAVVLGAFEGIEWVERRDDSEYEEITFKRDHSNGPWLVTDPALKRLWVVGSSDLDLPSNGFVRAVMYAPGGKSRKADARAYIHHFGDEGDDKRFEHGLPDCYPRLSGRGRSRSFVNGRYYIDERGIIR